MVCGLTLGSVRERMRRSPASCRAAPSCGPSAKLKPSAAPERTSEPRTRQALSAAASRVDSRAAARSIEIVSSSCPMRMRSPSRNSVRAERRHCAVHPGAAAAAVEIAQNTGLRHRERTSCAWNWALNSRISQVGSGTPSDWPEVGHRQVDRNGAPVVAPKPRVERREAASVASSAASAV